MVTALPRRPWLLLRLALLGLCGQRSLAEPAAPSAPARPGRHPVPRPSPGLQPATRMSASRSAGSNSCPMRAVGGDPVTSSHPNPAAERSSSNCHLCAPPRPSIVKLRADHLRICHLAGAETP
ncbi:hypothetical protein NDU88_005223 [Pleurodeles waltl]|uniref:Uncharacterized protein n=1 Tax=Pleurodeles waltl TaxID=8319 RepID=A0AAV7MXE3_PLEWA|nr:hypothetical protein NDU88_005223 [Pleurodeles waltl]